MHDSLRSKVQSPKSGLLSQFSASLRLCGIFLLLALAVSSQVPSPQSVLGFHPTDDRTIADWKQIVEYFQKLDKGSDRVLVKEIGSSTQDRPLIVAFISSSSNIKNLEKYRQISAKLADPRTVRDSAEAEDLIKSGKTIVSISCSIHSTEIVASQFSMNLAYELATANDADTKEILENTILLLIPSPNPDGIQIVADWYRKTFGTKAEGTSPPELYHYYAGHDDNRDWFMMNLKETRAITKLFWKEWFPQIVYDVHQQGQNASRFIIPPFYDPTNPRIPPSILRDVGAIGYKMAADLQDANIAGIATNSTYDTWWHGGFRTVPYFHNSIGILSEAASTRLMTPVTVKREDLARTRNIRGLPDLLTPATNYPDPWLGGEWRPRDIANIETIASRSLLQMAAKFRPRYLRNFYELDSENLKPKTGDPFAYIITAGQPNAEAVSRMLEILMWQGIEVYEMPKELYVKMAPDQADFHEMPLRSFIIFVNQPQKNNILTLFERQVYPHRLLPNGDAEAPYDVAGWTLPLQMGVDAEAAYGIRDLQNERAKLKPVPTANEARAMLGLEPNTTPFGPVKNPLNSRPKIAIYKGYTGSMDEGWTRYVFDTFQIPFTSLMDAQVRSGDLPFDVIVLPSMNDNALVKGVTTEDYPDEYKGGLGEQGIDNLKKYVENGGKIVCWDDSCDAVIKRFNLPIKNVLDGIRRNEFYNPGSVVRINVDRSDPLAAGMPEDVAAYFISSSAYELTSSPPYEAGVPAGASPRGVDVGGVAAASGDGLVLSKSANPKISTNIVARYPQKDVLLSGWMLGEKYLNGKAALVEANYGKGKIILFGFRPQHRAQTWGTFRFIFNALEK